MKICVWMLMLLAGLMMGSMNVLAQESNVKAKKSSSWEFSGRVQLQHAYNEEFNLQDDVVKHGFRIRRARIQTKASVNSWLSGKIQVDVRDNSPRLKDAEGKIKLFNGNYNLRFGQFKIPVWREEFLRSSGDLIMVERSLASSFLIVNLLSARNVGLEFGGKVNEKFSFAINYNNGAGEGNRELGNSESRVVNDGKMWVGRVDFNLSKVVKVGVSGAVNQVGQASDSDTTTGNNTLLAPDFGIYLPSGIDIEGAIATGIIDKSFIEQFADKKYTVWNLSGRWKKFYKTALEAWGGLNGFELAASATGINSDVSTADESNVYKGGFGLYFGKRMRLQSNFEYHIPVAEGEDNFTTIRTNFTLNF